MEYQLNETKDIKVIDKKGNIKWLPKKVVENKNLMDYNGFEVVQKPISQEPK